MNNPFLKYVMKDNKEDIFHTSTYGQSQNPNGIGVASTGVFNKRLEVDRNRSIVKGYRDSDIVSGAKKNAPRAKTYTPPEPSKGVNLPKNTGNIRQK